MRLGSKVAYRNESPLAVGRPLESIAGTMPVGPRRVNDDTRTGSHWPDWRWL